MMPMGVTLHTGDMSMEEIITYARRAEELGYHGFWVLEESGKDGIAVLTVVAGATERIVLATGIMSFYARTPLLIAMGMSALDQYSHGRALLGLGPGGRGFVERGHGVPLEQPLGRAREYVAILRRLFGGEMVSYDGALFHLRAFRLREKPVRADLPIYLSALNPRMMELAGEIADGVILNFLMPEFVPVVRERVAAGAARARRDAKDVQIASLVATCADASAPDAIEAVKKAVAFYCAAPTYHYIFGVGGFAREVREIHAAWEAGDTQRAASLVPSSMVERFTLTGPPERIRATLTAFARENVYPIIYPIPRRGRVSADMHRAIAEIAEVAP